ncbi:MAG: hypothetical protein B7Z69_04065 [Actinobacteria bacterium 21-73-9]|nr:MAG: hypothetical protein B7Z69_04065 [Actinobacteria bacterium 21-73-9]
MLRNYWVTQTYADLSRALAVRLAPDTVNWCTFGCWASATVGSSMRGEAMPAWLRGRVRLPDGLMGAVAAANRHHGWSAVAHLVGDLHPNHVLDVVRELLGQMAINLSNGNTEVFAEIAPPAATLLAYDSASPEARAAVLAACDGAPELDGENWLAVGYGHWLDALDEPDPTRRSQLVLAGSLRLGGHEQNHLQPAIAGAMDMGVDEATARLRARLGRDDPTVADAGADLDRALEPVARALGDAWGTIMTDAYGVWQSPEGTWRLDRDVPAPPTGPFVPVDVADTVVEDLATLRTRFERADAKGLGSAARDWEIFDERMNFITSLFVSRHHSLDLLAEPFDDATRAALEADTVPPEPA